MTDSLSRTIIESVGTYLPPREVTTAEIMQGCTNTLTIPLERLTGIHSRRRAGDTEFAIDLAHQAILDCLSRSSFGVQDIDVIVSTNISRWDGRNQVFFEPPTSCRLKRRLGLPAKTLAIDISNACAGMWTGVFLVDALLRSGDIRCGIVVSGEYITHLVDTAQKEVVGFMDNQLASLTLGDAGAAVTLTRGQSKKHGLVDFDLYTLSKFSPFCVAKPTDKSHGGAAMFTDSIKVTEAVIPHVAKHAKLVLSRNNWQHEQVQHVIPHQTSELTMKAGMRELRKLLGFDYTDRLINNLRYRGNTSSNAHFVALHDAIQEEKINAGESIVFCISGSGQSTGTALYIMDDLPSRMRQPVSTDPVSTDPASTKEEQEDDVFVMPVQLEIEAYGIVHYPGENEPDTVTLLAEAAEECLKRSKHDRNDMNLLIAACTYRSEFLMEPAIAALTAGVLGMNDDREPQDEKKTFAFDVTNGEVGFLKSVYLATEFTRVGRANKVMVLASEVENNITRRPDHTLGVRSMASAIVLQESTGDSGFLCFGFTDFANHAKLREVHAGWHEDGSRIYLTCNDDGDIWPILLDCLVEGTEEFFKENDVSFSEIDWILPTQHTDAWIHEFADRMAFDPAKLIDLKPDQNGNPLSSTFPLALETGRTIGQFRAGDVILIASVCPGVQVGCTLYRV